MNLLDDETRTVRSQEKFFRCTSHLGGYFLIIGVTLTSLASTPSSSIGARGIRIFTHVPSCSTKGGKEDCVGWCTVKSIQPRTYP